MVLFISYFVFTRTKILGFYFISYPLHTINYYDIVNLLLPRTTIVNDSRYLYCIPPTLLWYSAAVIHKIALLRADGEKQISLLSSSIVLRWVRPVVSLIMTVITGAADRCVSAVVPMSTIKRRKWGHVPVLCRRRRRGSCHRLRKLFRRNLSQLGVSYRRFVWNRVLLNYCSVLTYVYNVHIIRHRFYFSHVKSSCYFPGKHEIESWMCYCMYVHTYVSNICLQQKNFRFYIHDCLNKLIMIHSHLH